MSALNDKTLILGVGAQKAGTSWLRHYLANRSDVWMAKGIKEMNVLNVLFGQSSNRSRKALQGLRHAFIESGDDLTYSEHLADMIDRVRAQFQPHGYRQFFESRVGSERFFGDITPAYAHLPPEAFSFVKSEFPKRKVIFLLRDPVERHFSALRMREQRSNGSFDSVSHFLKSLDRPGIKKWSDYPATYRNLISSFSKDDIFVGFYETLFSDDEIRRLCEFLEIAFVPGSYDDVKNPSAPKRSINSREWQAAREAFEDVYKFCKGEFGSSVPREWN